jgi:hypothetical protein
VVELENRNANGSPNALPGTQQTPGSGAGQGPSHLRSEVSNQAENAKDQIRSLAEMGKDRVAEQLDQVARALRGAGETLRSEEQEDASYYTDTISEQMARASRYLRDHEAMDLVDGIERLARRQPALFLGGALVAGLAIGRFFKSSPDGGERRLGEGSFHERDSGGGGMPGAGGSGMGGPGIGSVGEGGGYGGGYGMRPQETRPSPEPVVTTPVQPVGGSASNNPNPPSGTFGPSGGGTSS